MIFNCRNAGCRNTGARPAGWPLALRGAAATLALASALGAPAFADEAAAAAKPVVASVVVIGERRDLLHIPGAGATIEAADIATARVFTVNEALRQVAGVFPRDEEGLGLRPNIGIRGLSPTRSTKTLLLEDGLPLAYAPYGDNASYSHPSVRRFQRIEVLKGASQIRFGPHSVAGVVNYVTPDAPETLRGGATLAGGDKGYGEIDAHVGGALGGARLYAHVNHIDFDGYRANHNFQVNDLYLKAEQAFGDAHEITLRAGAQQENNQISYSGLTEAEFALDPFSNPFPNDRFDTERYSGSATHAWTPRDGLEVRTSAYSLYFGRDWWRQSSRSTERPNDSRDPGCGGLANLSTTCGNEGRLREYHAYGVESRLGWETRLAAADTSFEFGARWHTERQNRHQVNADTPFGRTPGTSPGGGEPERQRRYADAVSAWATATFDFGRLALSPGVRFETIDYERVNLLNGQRGETRLDEAIPGLGATFDISRDIVLYGGVHRGFSPPRVEDVLTGGGGVVDLDAERSTNWEIGLRGEPAAGASFDIAAFVLDFENQIVPASVAGGVGATLTSAGETRHSGVEAAVRLSSRDAGLTDDVDVFFRSAATWVGEAEFAGRRFSSIGGSTNVRITGNRLPYAPEWIASAALGATLGDWLTAQVEVQHTGEQFSDDLNTVAPAPSGQQGLIEAATIWNLAVNVTPQGSPFTVFVTVKNLADETYIVDRTRGVLPGAPRLVQAGVSLDF